MQWCGWFPRNGRGRRLNHGGGLGALAIEMHQVGQNRAHSVLAKERGHLAAMVAAVIDQMLHRLPQGIAVDAKLQGLVLEYAVQVGLRNVADEIKEARLELPPAVAEAGDVCKLRDIRKRSWGAALKALEPDPLRAVNVRERVSHGGKARTHRLGELLRRER